MGSKSDKVVYVDSAHQEIGGVISLPASKSIANRILVIRALSKVYFPIQNLSKAKDTEVLNELLMQLNVTTEFDAGIAGTTYRFLTALLSFLPGERVLTGAQRMKERPIGILVDALRTLGARIDYLEREGYPPLKIVGGHLKENELSVSGSMSSQYLSALCMIGPLLPQGLRLTIEGDLVSRPYLMMTLSLMEQMGCRYSWDKDSILLNKGEYTPEHFTVESDWSAASYWYSLLAIARQGELELPALRQESLQGDAALVRMYANMGIATEYTNEGVKIRYTGTHSFPEEIDLLETPDLAQTIAVTYAALGRQVKLKGLKTLRIKETDRLFALKTELEKMGAEVIIIGDDELHVQKGIDRSQMDGVEIETYNDHRMAMAFAPLSLLSSIRISDPDVVSKSYPHFWEDWNRFFKVEVVQ